MSDLPNSPGFPNLPASGDDPLPLMAEAADSAYQLDNARLDDIDDCWNRIGVRGDRSCERLIGYVHCRNCPVHDAAAARVLDRVNVVDVRDEPGRAMQSVIAAPRRSRLDADTVSYLVFRIGGEWLGLPTTLFRQVAQLRPIHSLPHRRHRAVLGVVNVRGVLTVCASLARLFGIESSASAVAAAAVDTATSAHRAVDARELGRLLVVEDARDPTNGPVVFPVDAVDGVHRFARADFQAVPATLAQLSASHAEAVVAWKDTTVGLLDADKLLDTLNRSLT